MRNKYVISDDIEELTQHDKKGRNLNCDFKITTSCKIMLNFVIELGKNFVPNVPVNLPKQSIDYYNYQMFCILIS